MSKQQNKSKRGKPYDQRPGDQRITMYSGVTPVATRLRTKLNYVEIVTPSGLPFYEYVFTINSLFDPNRTGAGHQPLGFDQLSALYARYRVYAVQYEVNWLPSTSGSDPCMIICVPTNDGGTLTSNSTALEAYTSDNSKIGNIYNAMWCGGVVNLAALNGKTLSQYADDDTTQAQTSASPTEVLCLHTIFTNLLGSNAVGQAVVKLRFDVEFSDPVQLSAS